MTLFGHSQSSQSQRLLFISAIKQNKRVQQMWTLKKYNQQTR